MAQQSANKISIITSDISSVFSWDYFKRKLRGYPSVRNEVRGPSAVLGSLQRGLNKMGIPYQLNPPYQRLTMRIIVLSSLLGLKKTIDHKPFGAKLLAGPNLVIKPSEARDLFISPKVNKVVVNSFWTGTYYQTSLPEIGGKLFIWPAGVDENYWCPDPSVEKNKILLYVKNDPGQILGEVENYLKLVGAHYLRIEYGQYLSGDFLDYLNQTKLAIFLSSSESQGIALAEAWACNVPTLVWNPGFAVVYKGTANEEKIPASSAPYISQSTGECFENINEFIKLYPKWLTKEDYLARHWVLENMTDEISAQKLIAEFEI